jgi:hypothetical protein
VVSDGTETPTERNEMDWLGANGPASPRRKDSVDFGRYQSAASLVEARFVEAHDVWPEASEEDVSKLRDSQ